MAIKFPTVKKTKDRLYFQITINAAVSNADNALDKTPTLTYSQRETRYLNHYQDFNMNGKSDVLIPNLDHMCFVKAFAAMSNDLNFELKIIRKALNGINKNTVDCKWVFKIKHNSNSEIERYKTCPVTKGFFFFFAKLDYNET